MLAPTFSDPRICPQKRSSQFGVNGTEMLAIHFFLILKSLIAFNIPAMHAEPFLERSVKGAAISKNFRLNLLKH